MKFPALPFMQIIQGVIKNPRRHVIMFMGGSSVFFAGLGLILVAGQFMPEGEMAEWVALLGLVVLALGALIASVFYIGLLLNRVLNVWFRD
ncbi:MAG: hypothetical protein KUG53_02675 [Pseudomonadales bacterium]|nr:hypothetical protein [Pseudomonadales bacterium]